MNIVVPKAKQERIVFVAINKVADIVGCIVGTILAFRVLDPLPVDGQRNRVCSATGKRACSLVRTGLGGEGVVEAETGRNARRA